MHTQLLRIKRLNEKNIVLVAARHNLREIQTEIGVGSESHIDPDRVCLNFVLEGPKTASGVAFAAQSLMDMAGIKNLRKDAVRALEVIVSLPPDSNIDARLFFSDSLRWTADYFKAPIISAVIHNDESAPHCHVLILPLIGGRMVGSDLHGGRAKLLAMQSNFHEEVGLRYGMARQTHQKRHSAAIRKLAIQMAYDSLQANSGLADAVLRVLVDAFQSNPEPLMMVLGLDMPKQCLKSKQTFAGVMTKPCKPKKHIGFVSQKHIGFDGTSATKNEQTLSCVGFQIPDADNSVEKSSNPTPDYEQIPDDYVRERDTSILATHWNFETGEFYQSAPEPASNKTAIRELVTQSIRALPKYSGGGGTASCL